MNYVKHASRLLAVNATLLGFNVGMCLEKYIMTQELFGVATLAPLFACPFAILGIWSSLTTINRLAVKHD